MIALHRPRDVDTTSALALVPEEELAQFKPRAAVKEFGKGAWKPGIEKTKTSEVDKGKHLNPRPEVEDKLSTLKEFRKKNGLCFKCGNKWAPGYKCPQQVPLHVIEEILDALVTEGDPQDDDPVEAVEETMLAVGHSNTASVRRKTLKLCGTIGKMDVLILVDSVNVGTFISS